MSEIMVAILINQARAMLSQLEASTLIAWKSAAGNPDRAIKSHHEKSAQELLLFVQKLLLDDSTSEPQKVEIREIENQLEAKLRRMKEHPAGI